MRLPMRFWSILVSALLVGALLATSSSASAAAARTVAATSGGGGSIKVLEPSANYGSWPGLDPGTDTSDAANQDYLNAIYGELFEQGPKGVIPDLASGYTLTNDLKTLTIHLRRGVTFTDGTPFNAQAVVYNFKRDLDPKNACICLPSFPVASITSPNQYTVVMNLSRSFAPIVSSFFAEAPNWIISPTALAKMGEAAFALKPVGAGPFTVVTDAPSSTLTLKRNPNYWQKGLPYLDTINFASVGTDQSAYNALLAGQGQAYQEFATYTLIPTVKKHLKLTAVLPSGTGASAVQLNTTTAPFNNLKAREAMYYATNPGPINKALYGGLATPTQSLRSPGELFFEPKVPGYRTYNLAKAKALVQQLGGLSIQLDGMTTGGSLATAVAGEWAQAGIKTTINLESFEANIADYKTNDWQVKFSAGGGYDPGILLGLNFWYASDAPFTGNHDATLNNLIQKGVSVASTKARAAIYKQIYKYISDNAYSPVLFSAPLYNLSVPGVSGPGLTTQGPQILWQEVKVKA
jgi:peptide/nickel transport system substrate-binding protein